MEIKANRVPKKEDVGSLAVSRNSQYSAASHYKQWTFYFETTMPLLDLVMHVRINGGHYGVDNIQYNELWIIMTTVNADLL